MTTLAAPAELQGIRFRPLVVQLIHGVARCPRPFRGGILRGWCLSITPPLADGKETTMTIIETALLINALARFITAIAAVVAVIRAGR